MWFDFIRSYCEMQNWILEGQLVDKISENDTVRSYHGMTGYDIYFNYYFLEARQPIIY